MGGFAKDGVLYPSSGVLGINDNIVSANSGWSSQKIMSKLANIKSIIRVDAKPTLADGTITYVKDGTNYTTTDHETWFYYVVNDELYKTIFIDGVEYTKADSGVDFDSFIKKTSIATVLDETVTDEQVLGAKTLYDKFRKSIRKTGVDLNTLTDAGEYFVYGVANVPNTALGGYGFLRVQYYDGTGFAPSPNWGATRCVVQTFIQYHNTQQDPIMIRKALFRTSIDTEWQWGEWEDLCATKIADVPKTTMSSASSSYHFNNAFYSVVNNVCYVIASVKVIASETSLTEIFNLPKSKMQIENSTPPLGVAGNSIHYVLIESGSLFLLYGEVGKDYIFSFSYPVAE